MLEVIERSLKDDEGASLAEYAILLAVIIGAMVAIIQFYTISIGEVFNFITQQFSVAQESAAS